MSLKLNMVDFPVLAGLLGYVDGSAAASGWAGLALAHLEFGSSVNPIITRGADFAALLLAHPDLKT